MDASLESELSVPEKALHVGPISCIDLQENGSECVSVGEDGRVNLVSMGDATLNYQKIFDSKGLVSYTAAKWASPTEFATGRLGFSLQWCDQRKPGEPVSQFKGHWDQRTNSGIVHSLDIHPTRKHYWQEALLVLYLHGIFGGLNCLYFFLGLGQMRHQLIHYLPVRYGRYSMTLLHVLQTSSVSSARVLPAMICLEDGILAVIEQGEEPIELLVEPCAINSFGIHEQNPSDVICSMEWESIAILSRA